MEQKSQIPVRTVVLTGALTALSVALRLLGWPQIGSTRYDLGFLPIAAIGRMFGPLWSGAAYAVADVIGTPMTGQAPFLPITGCKAIFGLIMGLFLYKKRIGLGRAALCMLAVTVVVDLAAMPLALAALMRKGAWVIFAERLTQAAVMFPVRAVGVWLMDRYLGRYMDRY